MQVTTGVYVQVTTGVYVQVTTGVYAFIVQLNEGRANKKRPTEFRVDKVCQPFDASKFNFKKAAMKEVCAAATQQLWVAVSAVFVLCVDVFVCCSFCCCHAHAAVQVLFQFTAGAVPLTRYHSAKTCGPAPNLVLINVSPIEYGHVLLVPRANDGIPQVVDQTSMLFALQCAHEVGNPFFRLGYNSLGAFGTINHLHFQGYFLEQPYPAERAPTAPLAAAPGKVRGVCLERLQVRSCTLPCVSPVLRAPCVVLLSCVVLPVLSCVVWLFMAR